MVRFFFNAQEMDLTKSVALLSLRSSEKTELLLR